jgi:dTDP-4-amino-4,6-dideoxygalactose transaminase
VAEPIPPVAFLDLGATYRELQDELDGAWRRVMESGWFVLGTELTAFEERYARSVEADHAIGVASGLDALVLALRALDIGPGDEVIVPSNTYVATWLAVSAVGAVPVPVEPDPTSHCMDPANIEAAITPATRAILPVHLYGHPADLEPIIDIARRHGCAVIDDAAQAHGARYQGRAIGAIADITCWSFYPGKNLGAYGDGGAVTTDRADLADRVRLLRNYGSREKYVNVERGVNSRLDELQAALLGVKIAHLADWNQRRARIAARYLDAFAGLSGLHLPSESEHVTHAWHLFVIRSPERDALQARLAAEGIQTLIHYPIPPHRQEAYADLAQRAPLPLAEQLADEVISLPIGPHLTDADVDRVIGAVIRSAGRSEAEAVLVPSDE